MTEVHTTSRSRVWSGPLTIGVAVGLLVTLLDTAHLASLREARVDRMNAIGREIAASIRGPEDLTAGRIAEWNRITGSVIRIRDQNRTLTSDGQLAAAAGNLGVRVPRLPDTRVEVWLPSIGVGSLRWFPWDAVLLGGVASVLMAWLDRRRRRDLLRMKKEIRLLVDPERRIRSSHVTSRVTMPDSRSLQEIARPLNDLIEFWSGTLSHLQRQSRRHDLVLNSMTSGVIAINADRSIDSLNPAARRLFEISAPEPRGLSLSQAVQEPDVHELVTLAIDELASQRRTFVAARSPGDQDRELATSVAPIMDRASEGESPRLVGAVILVEDATDLRLLERSRTEFVGNVSHELRTPLTNLLGYLDTVRDMSPDEEETRSRFLETAERNAVRLATIIEDLLELAKLEAPGHSLERRPIRLGPLLDRIAARHRSDGDGIGSNVDVTVEANVEVVGSSSLLDQAVDNLTSNALRYGGPEGRVRISATVDCDQTTITVADEGPGIAPRHLPRLFERFYRVDNARSRAAGGTGLGLAIVKHIAVAHGGRVRVESELGVGTRFMIDLPYHAHDGNSPPPAPEE